MRDLLEALDASVRKAQAAARETRTADATAEETPAVDASRDFVKPTVTSEAADAAFRAFERGVGYSDQERVRRVFAAALPHLLPGMFVTHEKTQNVDQPLSTIWQETGDPWYPKEMLARTSENAALFDAVAALLPIEG